MKLILTGSLEGRSREVLALEGTYTLGRHAARGSSGTGCLSLDGSV